MKKIFLFTTILSLLAGCAGYNTTMFTTKSNAGLDLDMKPPTAEITISRKEGVLEPSFEKGQAPPVMASFKPRVGFGSGFKNYFLGVDQTFAGGDAAQIMSVLYDSPTIHSPNASEPAFDSALTLTKKPTGSSIWGLHNLTTPAEPGDIRPLVFATDTILGLKVAWSGAAGAFPDAVKAGFNRKEFAWAPLTMTEDGKSFRIKTPAFLATIQSRIAGGSTTNGQSGGISSIQYFATGEAAKNLAYQRDVRDAMLARLDPHYKRTHLPRNGILLRQKLNGMESAFTQLAGVDPIAKTFLEGFKDLKYITLPDSFEKAKPVPMHYYSRDAAALDTLLLQHDDQTVTLQHAPKIAIDDLATYVSYLDISREALTHALGNLSTMQLGRLTAGAPPGQSHSVTPSDAKELQAQLDIQNRAYETLWQEIVNNGILGSALQYFKSLSE
jgi:hypothetical protein